MPSMDRIGSALQFELISPFSGVRQNGVPRQRRRMPCSPRLLRVISEACGD